MKMYRQLGKYELDDLIEAVKWLRGKTFIDSTKIAITGASYGGYVACLALTRGADYFTHGTAYYSVTDWQLYDAVYTERFMDLPMNNPAGYKYGSALTYAQGYKGELMLIHGSMDDNVHVQNSIQLVDKLTDFEKDFEFVLIPDSRHGTTRSKRKFMRMKDLEFVFERLLNRPWPGWDR
jgi:dipeptidyl-peptidase-4